MYCIGLNKTINQLIESFYRIGLWHHGDEATARDTRIKLFYSIYCLFLPISMLSGALTSDVKDEAILLILSCIIASVLSVNLLFLIWKKNEVLALLREICVYTIDNHENFTVVNDKLKSLMKFVNCFICLTGLTIVCGALILPFLGSEKTLLLNIGFPLDWKNNEIAYWIAFTFFFTGAVLAAIGFSLSIIIWYCLVNCALRYEILGNELKIMGSIKIVEETDNQQPNNLRTVKQNSFYEDLTTGIKLHQQLNNSTQHLNNFFSSIFLIKLATSGACICGSVYCLVFNAHSLMLYIIFIGYLSINIFEIFMVMYSGNEITLSSDRISYCLFESDWVDQTQSCKKCLIIFAERLKQPQILILKSAYNMFNILQNL